MNTFALSQLYGIIIISSIRISIISSSFSNTSIKYYTYYYYYKCKQTLFFLFKTDLWIWMDFDKFLIVGELVEELRYYNERRYIFLKLTLAKKTRVPILENWWLHKLRQEFDPLLEEHTEYLCLIHERCKSDLQSYIHNYGSKFSVHQQCIIATTFCSNGPSWASIIWQIFVIFVLCKTSFHDDRSGGRSQRFSWIKIKVILKLSLLIEAIIIIETLFSLYSERQTSLG